MWQVDDAYRRGHLIDNCTGAPSVNHANRLVAPPHRQLAEWTIEIGTVSEIDTASWAVTRRLAAGQAPEHVVLAPGDRMLYVNNVADGTVSAVRLADGRTTASYAVGAAADGIDISDDGATLYVSGNAEGRLVAIDLASGTRRDTPLAPAPYHVAAIHGQGTVYVSSRAENRIWVLDQKTLELRADIAIGGIGHQMVVPSGIAN